MRTQPIILRVFRATLAVVATLIHATAFGAVGITVSPAAISNTYVGMLTIQITGLANGETVTLQKYLDLNGNATIDASDLPMQQLSLTDGYVPKIGGVTNIGVPFDTTGTNGAITVRLNFTRPNEIDHFIGRHLFRVFGPSGAAMNSLLVTNWPYGQTIRGLVRASGTNVPNAIVIFMDGASGNLVCGTVASSTGGFTNRLPAGHYQIAALRPGFVCEIDTTNSVYVNLPSGGTVTTNVTLTPSTRTVSGRVVDAGNTNRGLPALPLLAFSEGNKLALGSTDTNGYFSIPFVADYGIIFSYWLPALGYVAVDEDFLPVFNTTTGNVANLLLTYPRANALIYGSVRTHTGTPLAGVSLWGESFDEVYESNGVTDTNGMYAMGVIGPSDWYLGADLGENLALKGYLIGGQNTTFVGSNQAVRLDFVAIPVTGTISGWVRVGGTNPVPFVDVYGWAEIGTNTFNTGTETDQNGYYQLPVANGTWTVGVSCWDLNDRGYQCVQAQTITVPPANAVVNFMVYPIEPLQVTTASLPNGTVGQYYSAPLYATGGQPPYYWSLAPWSAPLPPGLSIWGAGNPGYIEGIPTTPGTYNFTVQVADSRGVYARRGLSITISPGIAPLQIVTTNLPAATAGQPYSGTLLATGGVQPYFWSLAPGSATLPPGLSLRSDGSLVGTPVQVGNYEFDVRVIDPTFASDQRRLRLNVQLPPLTPPAIGQMRVTSDGQLRFSFDTVVGRTYTLLHSTTLTNWVPLLSFQGPGGPVTFSVPISGSPAAFFRVRAE